MAVGVLPICRQTPLLSTRAPETTYCPVLTFRGDRRDLILMLRLEEQNEEIASLLLPSKSIVTFRRVGCETSRCVQAASAVRGTESSTTAALYAKDRKHMSHCAKWNLALVKKEIPEVTNSCCQQMSSCPSLKLRTKKTLSVPYSIFTEQ